MAMHLTELKVKPITELIDTAREMGLENVGRSRKQEVIAAIVRKLAKNGEVEATKVGALSKSQLQAFLDSNI